MKKTILFIMSLMTITLTFGQPNFNGSTYPTMRPIWTAQQPSYYNNNLERDVNVYTSKFFTKEGSFNAEMVMFDIAGTEKFEDLNKQTIMFFDIPKLLGALDVCAEALSEVSTLSKRAKNALIEGMDTIFPRAAVMWHDNDTMVASYNNVLTPDIRIENGQAKLIITGKAVCRVKFNEKLNDPKYSGDENVFTEYSLVFSNPSEINELATIITNSVSEMNKVPLYMTPQNAFHRVVIDDKFNTRDFNGFMRLHNPTWDPTVRPFRPYLRPMIMRNY